MYSFWKWVHTYNPPRKYGHLHNGEVSYFYSHVFNYTNIFQVVLDLTKSIACCLSLVSLIFGLFLSTLEDFTKYMYFLSLSSHFQKTCRCCTCKNPAYFQEDFVLLCLLPVYCPSCGTCLLQISKLPHNLNSDNTHYDSLCSSETQTMHAFIIVPFCFPCALVRTGPENWSLKFLWILSSGNNFIRGWFWQNFRKWSKKKLVMKFEKTILI